MLLFVRFVLVMLISRFRGRIAPLDASEVRFTALPHDCDLNFHLNAGRYISFMDVARIELLGRMRLFRKVLARGWRPINGGMIIRFRRSVLPFERFSVYSRVVGWDGKWFYFEHLVKKGDELCAVAHARGLFKGKEGSVPPTEFLELAGLTQLVSPALPAVVQGWAEAEELR